MGRKGLTEAEINRLPKRLVNAMIKNLHKERRKATPARKVEIDVLLDKLMAAHYA